MPETPGPTPEEGIEPIAIETELKRSYLDYAMSVIVSRALPDVRDGLKPVHRRILYAMQVGGNTPDKPYKKSANIVGSVMGNFHPHGDSAIYDALVRMAQPFSMGVPLVDGQGNFGSIDNDPAAAMRYTESRMTKAAHICWPISTRIRSIFRTIMTVLSKSQWFCQRNIRTFWSMAAAASRLAWRRISRRTILVK